MTAFAAGRSPSHSSLVKSHEQSCQAIPSSNWVLRMSAPAAQNSVPAAIPAAKQKGRRSSRPLVQCDKKKLLLRRDCILRSLGYAELHHGLGLNLNRLAGLRIASHAGFAVRLHQAADAGNDENTILLGAREMPLRSCYSIPISPPDDGPVESWLNLMP